MGTGPKKWTEEVIARREKDGRGAGVGAKYKPWLYVQEFSSTGTQTRIPSLVMERTLHTFSYIERAMYLAHEFRSGLKYFVDALGAPLHAHTDEFNETDCDTPGVAGLLDYREQFPMDRRVTLGAAAAYGIVHPRYPHTKVPVVMTLDAVATRRLADGQPWTSAWDAKPARLLNDRRTLEKLTLHRAYCAQQGLPHFVFSEHSIPKAVIRNIDWARQSQPKAGELIPVPGLFEVHPQVMLDDLWNRKPGQSIRQYCTDYDIKHRLPVGTGIRLFKILLWRHDLVVDMCAQHIELERVPRPSAPPVAVPMREAA